MKITGVKIYRHRIRFEPKYTSVARSVGPLDVYEEYARDLRPRAKSEPEPAGTRVALFLAVTTDEGVEGFYGPVESRSELLVAVESVAEHLIGRDPMENRMLWDIMSRFDRHSRSGLMLMAISALDLALWDLKGKLLGLPVYKLLGGGRKRIRPYISTLGFSVEPSEARERALAIKAMGVRAQKWFFRYGPADGTEGIRKNLELAFALRDALGTDYELMFDCWMGWTVSYARTVFQELEQVRPMWVEEVLRPHMADGYRTLRSCTNIPLSAGEHLYTRMEVSEYLRDNIFAVMQSDPAWCGGLTEALRIAELCEMHGVTYIPHGHSLAPAMHLVASMPPDVCPYCEYLLNFMDKKNAFFTQPLLGEDGWLTMSEAPGLGDVLDEARMLSTEVVTEFRF